MLLEGLVVVSASSSAIARRRLSQGSLYNGWEGGGDLQRNNSKAATLVRVDSYMCSSLLS